MKEPNVWIAKENPHQKNYVLLKYAAGKGKCNTVEQALVVSVTMEAAFLSLNKLLLSWVFYEYIIMNKWYRRPFPGEKLGCGVTLTSHPI
jgi:hypothetical protein